MGIILFLKSKKSPSDSFPHKKSSDPQTDAERSFYGVLLKAKDYDFKFDVESTGTIVCSELVYQVYTDVAWPTDKITSSPDKVALKVIEDGPFKTVFLYHDGQEVRSGMDRFMGNLPSNHKSPFARISPLN